MENYSVSPVSNVDPAKREHVAANTALAAFALSAIVALTSLGLLEVGGEIFYHGSYEVPIEIVWGDRSVQNVSAAAMSGKLVDIVADQYPSNEVPFKEIHGSSGFVSVSFGYKESPLLGRRWGYSESSDTVLFLVQYEGAECEFRKVAIPPRFSGEKVVIEL